jgi:hypothetical protein
MPTEGERIATVETILLDIRGDVSELRQEATEARRRLHKLEGIAGSFVDMQNENRRKEAAQYQKLGLRIQVLTVVVGLAAILAPIATVLIVGK